MTDAVANDIEQVEDDEITPEELQAVFENRAAQYGLLSRLFRKELDQPLIDELHEMHYRVFTGNEKVDTGNRLIATYLSNLWENSVTELAADYSRVFFGHGYSGHSAAYPYESVYVSERRLLMSSSRDEVLALYRSAKLSKQDSWKDSEDHVAMELEFMQILSERTVAALAKGDSNAAFSLVKKQFGFLEDHLAAWLPMLATEMLRFAKTDFYKGLAYMADGFVETDFELLDDLLADE